MARFVELVEADTRGDKRFRKASDGRSLGVEYVDGKPYIYIFEDGEAKRMLSRREIHELLINLDDDWAVANR